MPVKKQPVSRQDWPDLGNRPRLCLSKRSKGAISVDSGW
jgi:hypothetical protein